MATDTAKIEEWRPIAGWDGLYEVSSLGNVRSVDRTLQHAIHGPTRYKGRVLRPGYSSGYAMVTLVQTGIGRRQQYHVHILVLTTFVGPKCDLLEACHGAGGPHDNSVTNLRWDTRQNNALDRHLHGRGWPPKPKKPPTKMTCVMCKEDMWVTKRRKVAHNRVCSARCSAAWSGYTVHARRHAA